MIDPYAFLSLDLGKREAPIVKAQEPPVKRQRVEDTFFDSIQIETKKDAALDALQAYDSSSSSDDDY